MKCHDAENYMIRHFDKTIEPKDAVRLAQHVLECEECRELYVSMDICAEHALAEGAEEFEAPPDFTENVMAQLFPATETVSDTAGETAAPAKAPPMPLKTRIMWGFVAFFTGVGKIFMLNPEIITDVDVAIPAVETILAVVLAVVLFFINLTELAQQSEMAAISLALVIIIAALLFVLQGNEKGGEQAKI